jgi:hypothetical protein
MLDESVDERQLFSIDFVDDACQGLAQRIGLRVVVTVARSTSR